MTKQSIIEEAKKEFLEWISDCQQGGVYPNEGMIASFWVVQLYKAIDTVRQQAFQDAYDIGLSEDKQIYDPAKTASYVVYQVKQVDGNDELN